MAYGNNAEMGDFSVSQFRRPWRSLFGRFFNFQHPLKGSWRWKIAQMRSHLAKLASLWCIFSEKKFPEVFSWNIKQKKSRPNICRYSPQITLTLTYIRFIKLLDEYFWRKKIDPPPKKEMKRQCECGTHQVPWKHWIRSQNCFLTSILIHRDSGQKPYIENREATKKMVKFRTLS